MHYLEKTTTSVNVCNFQTMMSDNPPQGVQSHTQNIAISTLIVAVTKSSPVNVVPFRSTLVKANAKST
jgi:hypothetical protein